MKARKISGLILLFVISFFFTGCFDVNSEFRNVRNHVLSGSAREYKKDQEFALGPVSMTVARQFMKNSDDNKFNKEMIENISGLQIGIYKKKNADSTAEAGRPDTQRFIRICRIMELGGWIKMVRSFDKNEISAVFLKLDTKQNLKRMFVISMDPKELVLTEIRGNLEQVFESALREKGLGRLAIKK